MNKTILHFSDIHFGGDHAPHRIEALLAEIERRSPTVVAVSGDLTQRARSAQFHQAREFLDRISAPLIVVPGNHDVPLWNVFDRFLSPLEKYKRFITDDLNPVYMDEGLAVMGIDTTRSFTIKGGVIDREDLQAVRARLCKLPGQIYKVIVAHHPLAPPPGFEHEEAVGGVERAMRFFEECKVDMILTGHLHQSYVAHSKDIHPNVKHSIMLVQAGTAFSQRGRGSEHMMNSFNFITITLEEITVTNYIYSEEHAAFMTARTYMSPRHNPHPSPS